MNCVNCKYYVQLSGEIKTRGYCHGLPPLVFSGGHSDRPQVRQDDVSCSIFSARPEEQPVNVKTKKQPETPGLAAKVKRESLNV